MTDQVRQCAKAVAALITPFVLAAVAAMIERAGVNVPVDPSIVESAVTAVLLAVIVWAVPNRPSPLPPPPPPGPPE
jgi:DMSO/TMAO reductase YedYZ heme-binding membrane subunit